MEKYAFSGEFPERFEIKIPIARLQGLLPICSSCNKVRDDEGYWQQIESYISDHSDAKFSNGICPKCVIKLYGKELSQE